MACSKARLCGYINRPQVVHQLDSSALPSCTYPCKQHLTYSIQQHPPQAHQQPYLTYYPTARRSPKIHTSPTKQLLANK
ncbi:hypothetical protein H4Q26_010548 [Puccinia striiformis f. sp. tritici PST-130]|nr:hypothetical protein H4Q26_010548 [Puccinia striiformis f. sp. tritici PST-130]